MTGILHYDRRIPDLSHLHHQVSEPLLDPDVADSESLPDYSDVAGADVAAVIAFVTVVPVVAIVVMIEILKYHLELILFKN
ncbi:hypothetical protein RCL_jg6895.t1 [Rhizophagus clarus]|uniref:Uncharacterized protein n=1 Tax=Rhizophagus clarus TaxID=94130 RepID=A0A8H3LDA3_9GLOM|nr:hypothetical protein RCL_jg6895.t1 [Rhizophagus clarus]